MKKFMADRKNPALLGAAVVIVLLLVLTFIEHSRSVNARIVSVGNDAITRQDLIDRLKILGANDVLTQMVIGNLMVAYARQQNVTVTPDELRQFERFYEIRAAIGEKNLEEYVSGLGVTMEQWRRFNSDQILYIKLIVPAEDIKQALSTYANQYTFPSWYRYRRFIITDEKQAKEASDLLQKPDGVARVSEFSVPDPAPRPDGLRYYVDGAPPKDYKEILTALKSLKAGQVSRPFQITTREGWKPWVVVQAVDVHPQEKPTIENRGMLVGKDMMANDQKYLQRAQELRTEALRKIDVTFASTEFKSAYDTVTEMKNQSIYVPGPTGAPMPGLPGPEPSGAGPQGPPPSGPPPAGATPPAGGR